MGEQIRISVNGDTDFVDEDSLIKKEEVLSQKKVRQRKARKKRGPRNPQPQEWLAKDLSQDYIADYKPFNFVDGEGVRCSLYVSGCLFACPGCYNKAAQQFHYGRPYTKDLEDRIVADVGQSYCQGLTLLGGEPFLNTQVCLSLISRLRKEYGYTKDIWSWSGYTWEELQKESPDKLEMLSKIDILVDGRFLEEQKDLTLQFRGSANQRIIDVQRSLKNGRVILWCGLVH